MTNKPEISKVLSFREQVSRSNIWGHHFVFLNTILAIFIGSAYLYAAPDTGSFLGFVYLVTAWLGQMSFLGFLIYLIFFFPLSFMGNFKNYRVLSVIAALLIHTVLLVDAKLFLAIKAHLSWGVFSLMIRDLDFNSGLNFRFLFIAIPVIALLQLLFSRLSNREIYRKQSRKNYFPAVLMGVVSICFFVSHALHIWADATGYEKITVQRSVLPAHYPMTAKSFLSSHGFISDNEEFANHMAISYPLEAIESDPEDDPKNIIIVMVNGLSYADMDSESTPNLFALKKEFSSFENHYLPYEEADDNIFAASYGLPILYKESLLSKHTVPVTVAEMQHQEYQLRVFSSLNKKVLSQSIIPLAGAHKSSLSYLPDDEQLFENALTFIKANSSSHHYIVSISTSRIIEAQAEHSRSLKTVIKKEDEMLGSFIGQLRDEGLLENTMVVITSSQGNLLRQNPDETYSKSAQHVPLIVMWPSDSLKGVSFKNISSHFDFAPTVGVEILGIQTPYSRYAIGSSLLRISDRDYFVTSKGSSLLLISKDAVTVYRKNGRAYIEKNGEKRVIQPNLETLIRAISELNRFKG